MTTSPQDVPLPDDVPLVPEPEDVEVEPVREALMHLRPVGLD